MCEEFRVCPWLIGCGWGCCCSLPQSGCFRAHVKWTICWTSTQFVSVLSRKSSKNSPIWLLTILVQTHQAVFFPFLFSFWRGEFSWVAISTNLILWAQHGTKIKLREACQNSAGYWPKLSRLKTSHVLCWTRGRRIVTNMAATIGRSAWRTEANEDWDVQNIWSPQVAHNERVFFSVLFINNFREHILSCFQKEKVSTKACTPQILHTFEAWLNSSWKKKTKHITGTNINAKLKTTSTFSHTEQHDHG